MARSVVARILGTRWTARLPIRLYRAGLGFLLGPRLLLLEHTGRSSGRPRYVALEVVKRESPEQVVIASGFGTRAQWFKNLRADPRCYVSTGRIRRRRAEASILTPGQRDELLAEYQRDHPETWRRLEEAIVQLTGETDPDIPLVRLTLAPS